MNTDISSGHNVDRLVYTVAEAGALLGISRAFAYELVARGELPVIRLGQRRLRTQDRPARPRRGGPDQRHMQRRLMSRPRCVHPPFDVDVHSKVHTNVHTPAQVVTTASAWIPRGFARAVQVGGAEASDMSGAGP